jgi:glyoxylase-like metal-dependent hydrolase (beta-lactamase superfamily II)
VVGPPPPTWEVEPGRARAFPMAPGIWQLRLPLPWDVVPHVNAYVLETDDGVVLVDCGSAGHPSHRDALATALAEAGHDLGDVTTLVGTHTHSDHVGLAAWVIERSGCAFAMHPATAHFYDGTRQPERIAAARRRRAEAEGVPGARLAEFADTSEETDGVLAAVEPGRPLRHGEPVPGAAAWQVVETPGHAPSHVCLVDRERRAVILGDLVAPVFAPWFDYGYSPDPVAEFLESLDRIEALGRFDHALPGHGRAVEDLPASLQDHRAGVARRLEQTLAALDDGPAGAFALTERMFGALPAPLDVWRMTEVCAYLRHLRLAGVVVREEDGGRYVHRRAEA